ncbi:MAG: NTPase-like protein [Thermoleophilia bacterium]|jgi:WD40 repeat protein|nr:NTPase-like protein [Thermoleophilia bacterium]
MWDARTRQPLGQPLLGDRGIVLSVAFSPDGVTLASAGLYRTVRLWDVPTHKQLGEPLRGHRGAVSSVAFSPDGRMLASAGDDQTVRLWEGILWRDRTDLRNKVCYLVGGNLTKDEWAELAPGLAYHTTCTD